MRRVSQSAFLALVLIINQTSSQGAGQTPVRPTKPLTLTQVFKLDATYTDPQHGVTFSYPSAWEATTWFAYHPPALTVLGTSKPIAGFGYDEGGFPRGEIVGPYTRTNLEGFGLVYSAVPAANAAECESEAASLSDSNRHTHVVFGHRSFSSYETGEAGMSQLIYGTLYATYVTLTCYLFETDVAVVSPGAVDDIKGLTLAQGRYIDARLLDIMKSVRIVPRGR
jgi:hypothetical protein